MKKSKLFNLLVVSFALACSSCSFDFFKNKKEPEVNDVFVNSPLMTRGQFLDPCVFEDNGVFYLVVTPGNYDWAGDGEVFMACTPFLIIRSPHILSHPLIA